MRGSTYLSYFLGPYEYNGSLYDLKAQLPQCAAECFAAAIDTISACAPYDLKCICTNDEIALSTHACFDGTCTIKQALSALNVTATMCQRPVRDRTQVITISTSITGSIAFLAALLRTIDVLLDGRFGLSDACALCAGLCAIPMNTMLLLMVPAGFGRDTWTLRFDQIYALSKWEWIAQVFYWPTTSLSKMAFLLMYPRIFPRQTFQSYVYATVVLTFCYWGFFMFSTIFNCRPISLAWEGWDGEHEGQCWDRNHLFLAGAGLTVFLDSVIILLPIPELLGLSMSWKRKLEVLAIFAVGACALVVSCIRTWAIVYYAKSRNPTWDNVSADLWSISEANISVLCACMPAIRRLVVHRFIRWEDTRVTDSEEATSGEKPSNRLAPEGKDVDVGDDNEDSHSVEYPWEQTTTRDASRRPSKATTTLGQDGDPAPYAQHGENECIEAIEGPEGQITLLRHGRSPLNEGPVVHRPAPKGLLPDYDEDD